MGVVPLETEIVSVDNSFPQDSEGCKGERLEVGMVGPNVGK